MTRSHRAIHDSTRILIPSYKAAHTLADFLPALLKYTGPEYVCVVDDGSKDSTGEICSDFSVECITHSVNKGKGAALRTGFDFLIHRGAQWIISMDADGQHVPGDLAAFSDEIRKHEEAGIIIGRRSKRPGTMPAARIVSNALTSGILWALTGQRIYDSQCGYRAYSTRFLSESNLRYDRFELETEAIIQAAALGYAVRFVPVQTVYSKDSLSGSHISHGSDTIRWIRAVISTCLQRNNRFPAQPTANNKNL